MGKSLRNVIDPDSLADKYSPEALRYYLISDIALGKDADFRKNGSLVDTMATSLVWVICSIEH